MVYVGAKVWGNRPFFGDKNTKRERFLSNIFPFKPNIDKK